MDNTEKEEFSDEIEADRQARRLTEERRTWNVDDSGESRRKQERLAKQDWDKAQKEAFPDYLSVIS